MWCDHILLDSILNELITSLGYFNPRSLLKKIVTRSLGGWGGGQSDPPLSTFDKIHLIDLKFGTYNKLHLYFQLSKTTWCLIGFHGNKSQINDSWPQSNGKVNKGHQCSPHKCWEMPTVSL